jgi:signal transduction histidine kinase
MAIDRLISYVDIGLFGALALICLRTGRHRDTRQGLTAALSFGVIGVMSAIAIVLPENGQGVPQPIIKAILVVLIASPFALYRFSASFEGRPKRSDRFANGITAAVVVATVVAPTFPEANQPQPLWTRLYVVLYIACWAGLSAIVARRLWRAGAGLPSVSRHRMHTLAAGAAGLAMAGLPGLIPRAQQPPPMRVVSLVLPIVSGLLFALGFAPPQWLRMLWRSRDQAALRHIEFDLIRTDDRELVVSQVLPHVARLIGGDRAVLFTGPPWEIPADAIAIPLSATSATLVVQPGPYTPFFGRDEVEMVGSFARFFDLVLERTALLANERAARRTAEASRREIETLVYGLSHDLKSPLLTLLGHIEVLRVDHGFDLSEPAHACIARMESSAVYMEALLTDLLDLSRIGRLDGAAEGVDLSEIVRELQLSTEHANPLATIDLDAPSLPIVLMNAGRARQLLTNLVDNALNHSARPDVTIRIWGEVAHDGSGSLHVADDGVGIAPQHRETVFEMFERLPSRFPVQGTGLGLTVCLRIAESIKADICFLESALGAHIRVGFPADVVVPVDIRELERVK